MSLDGCRRTFFKSLQLLQFFSLNLMKLGTRDLCGNTQKTGTGFLNFDFYNFWRIYEILNFDLVFGTA